MFVPNDTSGYNPYVATKRDITSIENRMLRDGLVHPYFKGKEKTIFVLTTSEFLFLLPRKIYQLVIDFYDAFGILQMDNHLDVVAVLKLISLYAKKTAWIPEWYYLVNHELFMGYQEQVPPKDRISTIKHWLYDEHECTLNGSVQKWNEEVRQKIRHLLSMGTHDPSKIIPIDEYCDAYAWVKGKGVNKPGLEVVKWGKRISTKKSKTNHSFVTTPAEIKKQLLSVVPQELRCFQKLEAAKIRDIISGDLALFLKMDYVSTYIDAYMNGVELSTLFMRKTQRYQMLKDMVMSTRRNTLKLPLDQEQFDHGVTRDMIVIALEEIQRILPKGELSEVMQLTIESLLHPKSIVRLDDITFPYKKGIASGWRWTALLDTIINYAQNRVMIDNFCPASVISENYQGDDVLLELSHGFDVAAYLKHYADSGIRVNIRKNFWAYDRNEYLRMVALPDRLTNYPARSILATLFMKPTHTKLVSRYEYIITNLVNLITLGRRGFDISRIASRLVDWARKVDLNGIISYMFTPSTLGGFGMSKRDQLYAYLSHYYKAPCILRPALVNNTAEVCPSYWKIMKDRYNMKLGVNLSDGRMATGILSTLNYVERGACTIRKAEFKYLDALYPPAHIPEVLIRVTQPSAQWKPLPIHKIYYSQLRLYLVDEFMIDKICEFLTPESVTNLYILIGLGSSKWIIKQWLLGRLDLGHIKSSEFNPSYYDFILESYHRKICQILSCRNLTFTKFQQMALEVEVKALSEIKRQIMHDGFVVLL